MQKDKKPSTYKGCGKHKYRTRIEENSFAVWKFRRFSGKLAVLTRHLRPIRSQSEFADCSVMGSPSPLDRCWMLNDSPGALSLKPAVRAAVEWYWSDLQRAAASVLRDESLAAEIMEDAIAHAVAYPRRSSAEGPGRCECGSLEVLPTRGWTPAQATIKTRLY